MASNLSAVYFVYKSQRIPHRHSGLKYYFIAGFKTGQTACFHQHGDLSISGDIAKLKDKQKEAIIKQRDKLQQTSR